MIDHYRAVAGPGHGDTATGGDLARQYLATIATRALIAGNLAAICTGNTSMTMTMTGKHKTTRIGTLQAPPEAMPVVHRAAGLFRKVMEIEHPGQSDAVACVFQYRKGGRWQWGWAPHDAEFLLSQWLRRIYRATDRQTAITKAMDNIDWQGREIAARLALLGGV